MLLLVVLKHVSLVTITCSCPSAWKDGASPGARRGRWRWGHFLNLPPTPSLCLFGWWAALSSTKIPWKLTLITAQCDSAKIWRVKPGSREARETQLLLEQHVLCPSIHLSSSVSSTRWQTCTFLLYSFPWDTDFSLPALGGTCRNKTASWTQLHAVFLWWGIFGEVSLIFLQGATKPYSNI